MGKKLLIIPLIGFIIFVHALGNQFVIDDSSQIIENTVVHSIANIPSLFLGSSFGEDNALVGVYYKPVMTTLYTFIYSLFGTNPFPFHFVQLLLHISNALLIYLLLKRFFSNILSYLLSLIFLIHPINTQAVVYISSLQDPLFFFFGMIALLQITKDKLSIKNYLLFSITIFLSLLSKETGFLFILVSLIFRFVISVKERGKLFFLTLFLSSAYLLIHYLVVGFKFSAENSFPMFGVSLLERMISIPKMILYYLTTFFFPLVIPGDQMWVVKNLDWTNFYAPLMIDGLFFLTLLFFYIKVWRDKSSFIKPLTFFTIWFILGLGFHLQIFPLDSTVADRWFYFPMVGLLGMIGVAINVFETSKLWVNFRKKQLILIFQIIVIILILILSYRTFLRTLDWKDGLTLAQKDIQVNIDNFALENLLGGELIKAQRFDEALKHINKAIQLYPQEWQAWNNKGVIYRHLGAVKNDLNYIQQAKENFIIANNKTSSYSPFENLVETVFYFDSPKEARQLILDYLKIAPISSNLWLVLSLSEYQLGSSEQALETAKQGLLKNPNDQNLRVLYQVLLSHQTIEIKRPQY